VVDAAASDGAEEARVHREIEARQAEAALVVAGVAAVAEVQAWAQQEVPERRWNAVGTPFSRHFSPVHNGACTWLSDSVRFSTINRPLLHRVCLYCFTCAGSSRHTRGRRRRPHCGGRPSNGSRNSGQSRHPRAI